MQLLSLLQLCLLFATHRALGGPRHPKKVYPENLSTVSSIRTWDKRDIPSDKYFRESYIDSHYDARFGHEKLQYYSQRSHLSALIRAYLSTMADIGVETWLMHGSLLGWYWNRKIMPWDSDLDVQMSEKSMQHLADYYNMTIHHFQLPGLHDSRDYMLEVNPHWVNASTDDVENKIDARWLDMTTGLYVDITVLRWDREGQLRGKQGAVMCKDKHQYTHKDIFPLRYSVFEGMPASIPFAFANVLVEEYGAMSLSNPMHANHRFDASLQEWLPIAGRRQK
ncbi:hypothetical protein Q7P37_009828 [Cladosporium fusiforme]